MAEASIQRVLPGYEIGGELGRGAMGEVLAGRHTKLDRAVAIKRLPRAFSYDAAVRSRFGTEARVLASLSHPHIVPVYDYVEEEGLCLLVMQALSGGTVWERFQRDGLSMPAACAVLVATCAGLEYAHGKQVLHRDIKPDNLMFDLEQTLMVTDFGIATVLSGGETMATLDGQIIGTPAYMAPEQAEGTAVGPSADVYAAGTMFYELLSGRLPFSEEGESVDLLRRRMTELPVPIQDVAPTVPDALATVVMKAIARQPSDRYPTAGAFGLAIATAATEAWGAHWADDAEVRMLTTAAPAVGPNEEPTLRDGDKDEFGEAPASPLSGDRPAAGATVMRGAIPEPSRSRSTDFAPRVRPERQGAAPTTDLRAVDPREVIPISDLLKPPEVPTAGIVAAAILLLLLVVAAVAGLASSSPSDGSLGSAGVSVNGQSLDADSSLDVDLEKPIAVKFESVPAGATTSKLTMKAIGVAAAGSDTAALVPGPSGSASATLSGSTARVITSGDLTGEVSVLDDGGRQLGDRTFTIRSGQPSYSSVSGLTALAIALVALAYAASVSKPLRLGRRKVSALVGMTVIGAFVGLAACLFAWTLLGPQPSIASLVLDAALGAGAFGAGSWAMLRLGRRRRLLQVLGKAATPGRSAEPAAVHG